MNRRNAILLFGFLTLIAVVAVVASADIGGEDEDTGTRAPADNSYMDDAAYTGSQSCKSCHPFKYNTWENTLHNKKVRDATAENVTGDFSTDPVIGDLGTIDLSYNDTEDKHYATVGSKEWEIKWALGGGKWKQRYMVEWGNSTYILPIQFNTATGEWVAYNEGDWNGTTGLPTSKDNSWEKNCMGCHSTGYTVTKNTNDEWVGTYSELNIGCEACHGPGSDHITPPSGEPRNNYIWSDFSSGTCSLCHVRGKSTDGNHGFPNGMKPGDDIHGFFVMGPNYHDDNMTSRSHRQQWVDWNTTSDNGHAQWFEKPLWAPDRQDCMSCRSVEGFLKEIDQWDGDFRDEEDFPDEDGTTWIQSCVSCHEMHVSTGQTQYDSQLRLDKDALCIACHTYGEEEYTDEPHHPQREVYSGNTAAGVLGEVSGTPGMLNKTICSDCHMPRVAKSAVNYDISSHTFKFLRPEDGITFSMPDSCTAAPCHTTMSQENAQEIIDNWQERFEDEYRDVEKVYEEAHELWESAMSNGTLSEDLNESHNRASFNFHLLENENGTSKSVHNPDFVMDLIDDVESHSEEVIEGLSEGTITGTITDGTDPVEGVYVVAGDSGDTTDSDGTYTLMVGTSAEGETYTVKAFVGNHGAYTSDGAIEVPPGGSVTHDITLDIDTDNDGKADDDDTDDDGDGIPDSFEDSNGMDSKDATDAHDDDDGDGMTNLQEYKDGTDPQDASDFMKKGGKDGDDADTTPYVIIIIALIAVIAIMGLIMARKGGGSSSKAGETSKEE